MTTPKRKSFVDGLKKADTEEQGRQLLVEEYHRQHAQAEAKLAKEATDPASAVEDNPELEEVYRNIGWLPTQDRE